VSIKACVSWATLKHAFIIYWRIQDIWSLVNLVGSMVVELDNSPPYLPDVYWDSVGVTQ
jgi:hypothetical protein